MPKPSVDAQSGASDIVIRPARASDASELAQLLRQLGSDDPLLESAELAKNLSQRPHRSVLVAERDGRLLGTCTLHLIEHLAHGFARSAVLEDMVVDKQQRGLGIGQALIRQAIRQANVWSCYKLALSSATHRHDAHRFYQGLGFERHGVSLAINLKQPL